MAELKRKPKKSVKSTLGKVRSAPEKIVEHALNTAINTVEKAVETDMKRTSTRALKTAKKLEKAEKAAKVAKNDVKRAQKMSVRLHEASMKTVAKSKVVAVKEEIKEKIKTIVGKEKESVFYYDRKKLLLLTAVYAAVAVLVYGMSKCLLYFNMFDSWMLFGLMVITQVLCLMALSGAFFVVIFPQKLAVCDKNGIKIDHNMPLKWDDVERAEEKYSSSFSKRPFIALHLKRGKLQKYQLKFMQKLCRANVFTPFSIPLYAMKPGDAAAIRDIVKKHVKYQDSKR